MNNNMQEKLYDSDVEILELKRITHSIQTAIQERSDFRILYLSEVIEKAMYKAHFFGKDDLAERLRKQSNQNHLSYGNFKTLEDMLDNRLITEEEYNFCR